MVVNVNIMALEATADYEREQFVGMHLDGVWIAGNISSDSNEYLVGDVTPISMDISVDDLNSLVVFAMEEMIAL